MLPERQCGAHEHCAKIRECLLVRAAVSFSNRGIRLVLGPASGCPRIPPLLRLFSFSACLRPIFWRRLSPRFSDEARTTDQLWVRVQPQSAALTGLPFGTLPLPLNCSTNSWTGGARGWDSSCCWEDPSRLLMVLCNGLSSGLRRVLPSRNVGRDIVGCRRCQRFVPPLCSPNFCLLCGSGRREVYNAIATTELSGDAREGVTRNLPWP